MSPGAACRAGGRSNAACCSTGRSAGPNGRRWLAPVLPPGSGQLRTITQALRAKEMFGKLSAWRQAVAGGIVKLTHRRRVLLVLC
jgi:hypothetical protein